MSMLVNFINIINLLYSRPANQIQEAIINEVHKYSSYFYQIN
jgi:hypothetical protein